MNFEQLIRNWHKKVVVPDDYFGAFVFEYLAFIAYLKKVRHSGGTDRSTINALKFDTVLAERYFDSIDEAPLTVLVKELNKDPLQNVSRSSELGRHWVGEKTGSLRSTRDWDNLVEFWYAVRNNLFHGDKDPESARDARIVELAYDTISPLVALFVEDLEGVK